MAMRDAPEGEDGGTHGDSANAPSIQSRHEFMRRVPPILDTRADLDRHRDVSQRAIHSHDDLSQARRRVKN